MKWVAAKWTGKLLVGCLLTIGLYLGLLQLSGNFHEVIAGEFYRSAQPSAKQIADYTATFGIKTIINLRGRNDKQAWYREEIAQSEKIGLTHVDFRMSAFRQLTPSESAHLIAILRAAPKPILVHCQAGADRSGLVSVIYLQQIAGVDEETAEWQLSPLFGHVAIPYLSSAFAMDENWENLEKEFGLDS